MINVNFNRMVAEWATEHPFNLCNECLIVSINIRMNLFLIAS